MEGDRVPESAGLLSLLNLFTKISALKRAVKQTHSTQKCVQHPPLSLRQRLDPVNKTFICSHFVFCENHPDEETGKVDSDSGFPEKTCGMLNHNQQIKD